MSAYQGGSHVYVYAPCAFSCRTLTAAYCIIRVEILESLAKFFTVAPMTSAANVTTLMSSEDKTAESFRSSLDANYTWPTSFTFKFIVPQKECPQLLARFSVEPTKANASSSGRFTSYTFDLPMNSSQEVLDTYAAVSDIPGLISL